MREIRDMRLRGPYAEGLEPALESCMKIQRRTGVNGVELDAYASIRVVPPSFRSLFRDGRLFLL